MLRVESRAVIELCKVMEVAMRSGFALLANAEARKVSDGHAVFTATRPFSCRRLLRHKIIISLNSKATRYGRTREQP